MKNWGFLWKIVSLLLITLGTIGIIAIGGWFDEISSHSFSYPEDSLPFWFMVVPAALFAFFCCLVLGGVGVSALVREKFYRSNLAASVWVYILALALGSVVIALYWDARDDSLIKLWASAIGICLVIFTGLDILNTISRRFISNGNKVNGIMLAASGLTTFLMLYGIILPPWCDTVARSFPDLALREVVRDTTGVKFGFVTQSDLAGITELNAQCKGITSVKGLEKCIGLKLLNLDWNCITDISSLLQNSGLSKGDTVLLYGNPVDVDSINQLKAKNVSVDPYVLSCFLFQMGPPRTKVSGSVVKFPDPNLEALIRAKVEVSFGDIFQSDVEKITSISEMGFPSKDISDLTGLEYCTNLSELNLMNNSISNISPISKLVGLTKLNLGENPINNISALSGLTNLTGLVLYYNNIGDFTAISKLTNLTELILAGNNVSDVSMLSGLINLQYLYLDMNQITDISPLSKLTKLKGLTININQISNITPLSDLTALDRLWLCGNKISDVSALQGLTNLSDLALGNNTINDVTVLSHLLNLRVLAIENNSVIDISSFLHLSKLQELRLWNNPLSSDSLNTYILQLEARGVKVYR